MRSAMGRSAQICKRPPADAGGIRPGDVWGEGTARPGQIPRCREACDVPERFPRSSSGTWQARGEMRVGVFVVAYNAVSTLASVLDRIPESFRPSIDVVLVSDDYSTDETYEVGVAYEHDHDGLPITVVRQRRNLGYGGNQKFGYRWLLDRGVDVVVLLHGDGQYAPE